ncbi:MAG: WXG100 family type VII secretion target [Bacillota bacterium]|nr:WXG100 family type VII secretion target [Bacillota bacterium]
MAVNYVDYDVLTTGVSVYASQASALNDVLTALNKMNGELEAGWSNDTARAFIERFNTEHGPALQQAAEAIQSISDYINSYMQARQDDDAAGASAVRG